MSVDKLMGDGRTERVMFTCTAEMKDYLSEWAADERRSVSNLVEGLIADAIAARTQDKPPASGGTSAKGTGGKGRGKKGGAKDE